jgi:glycosyltransferase involved in cell wall biosynthesis
LDSNPSSLSLETAQIYFSIIVPTFNRAPLLLASIQTILDQTDVPIELIIVDDGSEDPTREVVGKLKDARLTYIRTANRERGAARNTGLDVARGTYVNYFDSDDLYNPCLFDLCEFIKKKNNPPVVFGGIEHSLTDGASLGVVNRPYADFKDNILYNNFLACGSVFVRRDVALTYRFSEDRRLSGTEDWELWLRLYSNHDFTECPVILFRQVQHAYRSLRTEDAHYVTERETAFIDHIRKDRSTLSRRFIHSEIDLLIADRLTLIALAQSTAGNRRAARAYWMQSVRRSFSVLKRKRFWAITKKIAVPSSFKSVLKAILPPVSLKQGFLLYNKIKIRTIDRIFFVPLKTSASDFLMERHANPFLALNPSLSNYSKEVQEGLTPWTTPAWTQDEYIFVFNKPGCIEPDRGWAMTFDRKLIYPSLGFARAPYVRKPDLLKSYLYKRKTCRLNAIISLRDTGEENYFHFFNDVIPKLYLLRDHGLNLREFTVVVTKKLYAKEYFKAVVENSWLNDLAWYVQDDEWIQFKKAVFCKPFTHTKKYFVEIFNVLKPSGQPNENRRIFLNRDRRSLRFIENLEALQPVLSAYGFEVVDSGTLPFREQINLFFGCRYVIGIHGAGLTNMLFRQGQPLSVLEIVHPFEYIPFHYMMLANGFGYPHHVLVGEKGHQSGVGGFFVDPVTFEAGIQALLQQ